mmetsp:Transcript_4210/g.9033  ORF Transcript_4210/g.9033 Transcript_4210/m.9033 type:complete len:332 (-) Transcript_4210:461-1456(-)|eukprot:CAMPEP_0119493540 /NCGR_PEP_ID=MMETSP1344-20130328/17762_1 /TAXON_ID=236787 /ORGANISM="Florenciella parvula, Strain CCMP2471" /LENGTH=331 /DNA_ID=CAMNT_0007528977 /DNA_START=269 /DNA_END=1264 /DNA_ORIENTATION=-
MPGSIDGDALSCSSKPTVPFPHYYADGTGRDLYMTGSKAPSTGKHFSTQAPHRDGAPRCGRTDPMPRYHSSGNGRDLYMQSEKHPENVVFPRTGKTAFSEKPPVIKEPFVRSRTDTMPRYQNDGTGRDVYLRGSGSGIPHTGKQYSSRPPQNAGSLMHLRTEPLPKYTPSGSGRDTFHRVAYQEDKSAWELRSYAPSGSHGGLAGRALSPKRATTAPGPMGMSPKQKREAHQRRVQQMGSSRLSAPKVHMEAVEPRGLMTPGKNLRPKSPPRPGSPSNNIAWRPGSPTLRGFNNPFQEKRAKTAGSPTRRRGSPTLLSGPSARSSRLVRTL